MSNNRNLPPILASLSSLSSLSSLGLTSSSVSTPRAETRTSAATATTNSNFDCSTPTASSTTSESDQIEWYNFCKIVNVSPPKHINTTFGLVKEKADLILAQSNLLQHNGFIYAWDSLEAHQQAGMAFIINEGILDCFYQEYDSNQEIAQTLTYGVLGIDKVDEEGKITIHGKAICRDLYQFVRKGGDVVNSKGNWTTQFAGGTYEQFRSLYKYMWGNVGEKRVQSCTIFSLNSHIEPILRFQTDFSMVCGFTVSALIIHYRQVIYPQGGVAALDENTWPCIAEGTPGNQGSKQTFRKLWKAATNNYHTLIDISSLWRRKACDSNTLGSRSESSPTSSPTHQSVAVLANDNAIEIKAGNYTLNIGRYMRHTLTADEKYETIFGGKGFVFLEVIHTLLSQSNAEIPRSESFLGRIDIVLSHYNTIDFFYNQVAEQLKHGALCARIRPYKGYSNTSMCLMEDHDMNFNSGCHFVTIIGVSRTKNDQHGGIMLLAQDSYDAQPFKNISLELLRAMKSTKDLFFILYNRGINMPNGSVFDVKPADIVTAGGLQLKRNEVFRFPDSLKSKEEERKEWKKRQEHSDFLYNPDYEPEWARNIPLNRSVQ